MDKVSLVSPNKEHEQQAKDFIQEFIDNNSEIHGVSSLNEYLDDYDGWLDKLQRYLNSNRIEPDRVAASTYFAIRKGDSRIVGMINIRHQLNDYLLKEGGHIGYGVRPSERRKGYATEILHLGLEKCAELGIDRALVTCDKDNIASARTIQNNFGILENEIQTAGHKVMQRYWIDVNSALEHKVD
jgi:predicted acetyltransferase